MVFLAGHGMKVGSSYPPPKGIKEMDQLVDLLSAPLTILLICCHIKSFRRVSPRNEARAGRRKEERRAHSFSSDCVVAPPVSGHRGVPARGVAPHRCHTAMSAVATRRAPPA